MRTLCLVIFLVGALTYASAQGGAAEASTFSGPGYRSKSFIISVNHQAASTQPYPRGANSKQVSITVGTGSAAVSYDFAVDTGSAALLLTCKTPTSTANCNGSLPASSNYELTAAKAVTGATCSVDNTGIGCLLPDNQCFISEPLTGNPGYYNINNGSIAQDTVTVQNVLAGAPLSFQGFFGCAEAYIKCTPADPSCFNQTTQCPSAAGSSSSSAGLFNGSCPGSGNGIEAGWTFAIGGAPSAMAVPEQIYKAGLISKKVTGICYQRPQKDASCALPLTPNSAVVLGPALPRALASTAQLRSAPLIPAVFPKPAAGSATPYTHTFRSLVNAASVPVFNSPGASWSSSYEGVSVLWDTGAYGQSTSPTNAYNAFVAYWQATSAAARISPTARLYQWSIKECASPSEMCGSNVPKGAAHACQQITMSGSRRWSPFLINKAKTLLASMYPPSIDVQLQGDAVAQLPTAFPLSVCSGPSNTMTTAVAVCSYVQATPQGSGSYFWLAGPWFMGRFVQFDSSAPAAGYPNSTGTVYWSDPINSCVF